MIDGYYKFPDDVQSVFSDTIKQYGFKIDRSELDAVTLVNNEVQLGFSINADVLSMSVKSDNKFYNVTDIVMLIDNEYYLKWDAERKIACSGLTRERYYQTYLSWYHILSDKFLLNTYKTGVIPLKDKSDTMNEENSDADKKYSLAWQAMQKLDLKHPIRQKYIFDDPSWLNDMLKLLEEG